MIYQKITSFVSFCFLNSMFIVRNMETWFWWLETHTYETSHWLRRKLTVHRLQDNQWFPRMAVNSHCRRLCITIGPIVGSEEWLNGIERCVTILSQIRSYYKSDHRFNSMILWFNDAMNHLLSETPKVCTKLELRKANQWIND